MIVLHYTGMATAEAAIDRLADPAAEVSAHYLVCPDGCIVRMVAEDMRAWHAGVARWGGVSDVNSRSIGIELVNPGHDLGYRPFAEPQMAALEALVGDIMSRHGIPSERVLGHACVAPSRKRDPGEKFDWRRLALCGLTIWADARDDHDRVGAADATRFQVAARRFGYGAPATEEWCALTLSVWQAFVMRFLPALVGSPPCASGIALIEKLAERWPVAPGA